MLSAMGISGFAVEEDYTDIPEGKEWPVATPVVTHGSIQHPLCHEIASIFIFHILKISSLQLFEK